MNINRKKHEILSRLYQQRLLSLGLISTYLFLSAGYSEVYCRKLLKSLLEDGLIKKRTDRGLCCYEITLKGVNFLKENSLIPLGENDIDVVLTPAKIRIDQAVSSHQLALNAFVLRFANEFNDMEFAYYDEKFCSFFPYIRPDGLLQVGNTIYLLEMDMGTERSARLMKKWNSYRQMISSTFFEQMHENIKVLFILDKASAPREKSLRKWIFNNLIDQVSDRFDIVIGDMDYLIDYLDDTLRPMEHFPSALSSFSRTTDFCSQYTEKFRFHSYLTMLEDGTIKQDDSSYLEFLYDDYRYNNMSTVRKLREFNRMNIVTEQALGRALKYVIMVPNEKTALDLLLLSDGFSTNVFFTTPERVERGIYEGFFQIHRNGTVVHFVDGDYHVPIAEYTLSNFDLKKFM